jgi:hypothetical protein
MDIIPPLVGFWGFESLAAVVMEIPLDRLWSGPGVAGLESRAAHPTFMSAYPDPGVALGGGRISCRSAASASLSYCQALVQVVPDCRVLFFVILLRTTTLVVTRVGA